MKKIEKNVFFEFIMDQK